MKRYASAAAAIGATVAMFGAAQAQTPLCSSLPLYVQVPYQACAPYSGPNGTTQCRYYTAYRSELYTGPCIQIKSPPPATGVRG
ncbi:hypothetical protein [Methylopila sp. M107]|uniref:hypothetical protein n=1 Tax=Methylopila sp. M107 TaxID=1101190 RepID=UPI0012DEA22E|nr:hypothetical protein [Methylopila sp. M107]